MSKLSACTRPVTGAGLSLRHLALLACAAAALAGPAQAAFTVFEGAGANPAAVTATRDSFRVAVGGGTAAGANGDFGGLRREINWDGVGAAFADPILLPANFFNVNSPRGLVLSSPTPGAGFAVSANTGESVPTLFGFGGDLQAFSAQRLFATVGSRLTDIRFFVPGTNTPATTSAFGLVFVDVEADNAVDFTTLEFFDEADQLIFSRRALVAGNQGLSFLGGVAGAGERIARVRITTPNNFLTSNGVRANESNDFVVMDDFLYAAPVAVPEPAGWMLALMGLGALGWRSRRHQSLRAQQSSSTSRCA
jgi:MYXO-CTERM domain-containing protein